MEPRKPMKLSLPVVPDGEVIIRVESWREDSPRNHPWEIWKPKYGKTHLWALTEKGVYDITEDMNKQMEAKS